MGNLKKSELKAKYKDEEVFVVPYHKIEFINDKFTPIEHSNTIWNMFDAMGEYIPRWNVEGEKLFQQIIPYIVILNESKSKIFTTKRIDGDSRLINKYSIACGGHINPCDGNNAVILNAAIREFEEEVEAIPLDGLKIIGYIRDKTSPTCDHTGIVMYVIVEDDIEVKEKDILIGEWKTLNELIDSYETLEGWSKYLTDYFVEQNKFI